MFPCVSYVAPGHCFSINADFSDIVTYWTAPLGYPRLGITLTFWHWRYLLYLYRNWITYLGQYQGNCFHKMERVGALYDRLASPRQNPWNLWFIDTLAPRQECDILVSRFANILRVGHLRVWGSWNQKKVSVSKNLVAERKSRFQKI